MKRISTFLEEIKKIIPNEDNKELRKRQELLTVMVECPSAEYVNFDAFSISDLDQARDELYEASYNVYNNNVDTNSNNASINAMVVTRLVISLREMEGKVFMSDLDIF